MGESCRRGKAQEDLALRMQEARIELVAEAVRKVCVAITDASGYDCIVYAHLGTEVLRRLGFEARTVAGGAVWRVGPGDGDVLSHSPRIGGAWFGPANSKLAGLFHAWCVIGGLIIDFTTWQLESKGRQLDEADGGKTVVQWCPKWLCVAESSCETLGDVVQGSRAGSYSYERLSGVEAVVLGSGFQKEHFGGAVEAAWRAYEVLARGESIEVVGV